MSHRMVTSPCPCDDVTSPLQARLHDRSCICAFWRLMSLLLCFGGDRLAQVAATMLTDTRHTVSSEAARRPPVVPGTCAVVLRVAFCASRFARRVFRPRARSHLWMLQSTWLKASWGLSPCFSIRDPCLKYPFFKPHRRDTDTESPRHQPTTTYLVFRHVLPRKSCHLGGLRP